MSARSTRKQVLVIGGGVAGLELASTLGRKWRSSGEECQSQPMMTLIDRGSAHVWKPMLHTIAAGTADISQQQTPYSAQARLAGFNYQPGEICGLDRTTREVLIAPMLSADGRLLIPARRLGYDALVVAVGSKANDFGTPGVAEHCMTIDSREQADAFQRELSIRALQCLVQQVDLQIAIVGGGATGVELAAELVQFAHAAVGYGAVGLSDRIQVTLIESGPRLLAAFPEDISLATRLRLESLGVRVLTSTRVKAATASGLSFGGSDEIPATLKVWAAGVKAPDFLSGLAGLEVAPSNQMRVKPSLQTTNDPNIFAIGDCASLLIPGQDRPLPATAQVAHQQAQHLIRHLPTFLASGQPIPDFVFRDFGSLVSLGEYDAYGSLGKLGLFDGLTIRGRLAQFSHVMLYRSHQSRLHGFWRGGLMWLVDVLNSRIRSRIRLD